jgi:hypothetical protein
MYTINRKKLEDLVKQLQPTCEECRYYFGFDESICEKAVRTGNEICESFEIIDDIDSSILNDSIFDLLD